MVVAVDNPTKVCTCDGNLGRHDDGRVQDSSGCGKHILIDAERVGCDRKFKNGHVSGTRGHSWTIQAAEQTQQRQREEQ